MVVPYSFEGRRLIHLIVRYHISIFVFGSSQSSLIPIFIIIQLALTMFNISVNPFVSWITTSSISRHFIIIPSTGPFSVLRGMAGFCASASCFAFCRWDVEFVQRLVMSADNTVEGGHVIASGCLPCAVCLLWAGRCICFLLGELFF